MKITTEHKIAYALGAGVSPKLIAEIFQVPRVVVSKIDRSLRERKCRVCGCTDDDCRQCIEATGDPCEWVAVDLCSRCEHEALCAVVVFVNKKGKIKAFVPKEKV